MERMTRRGQAPVKKELVEASMSAFVFWMGTIAIGYMLVANSGWSLPLFPHMLLLLLVFAVGSVSYTHLDVYKRQEGLRWPSVV